MERAHRALRAVREVYVSVSLMPSITCCSVMCVQLVMAMRCTVVHNIRFDKKNKATNIKSEDGVVGFVKCFCALQCCKQWHRGIQLLSTLNC